MRYYIRKQRSKFGSCHVILFKRNNGKFNLVHHIDGCRKYIKLLNELGDMPTDSRLDFINYKEVEICPRLFSKIRKMGE